MRLNFGNHLHIVEIGKDQIPAAFKQMKAEPAPESAQPLLRMTIKAPVSLHLTKLDGSANELKRQACGAKLLAHRETLDFGEIREIANPDATGRLAADIADQVRRRHVVAVEFLVI